MPSSDTSNLNISRSRSITSVTTDFPSNDQVLVADSIIYIKGSNIDSGSFLLFGTNIILESTYDSATNKYICRIPSSKTFTDEGNRIYTIINNNIDAVIGKALTLLTNFINSFSTNGNLDYSLLYLVNQSIKAEIFKFTK